MADENGLLENMQVIALLMASIIALRAALAAESRTLAFICIGFALLSVAFFLRELDLRGTRLPEWLIYPSTPKGSAIITTVLWLPYLLYALRHYRFTLRTTACYLRSRHLWLMVMAATLLVIGTVFEERLITVANYELFEESFETAGYLAFTWALFLLDDKRIKPCV